MYCATASYITVVLCFKLIVGDVESDIKNSTDMKGDTLLESGVKIPVPPDGPKESKQRRRGMESEMAYPQGYFPLFGGDFQPSTTPYDHVPMRRETVPIFIERTISSQPALIRRNPVHRTIVSNVYTPTQSGQQLYFHTNLANGYRIPGPGVYKTQGTFTGTSYVQKPLLQQPVPQIYNPYQDPNGYQPQSFYQVPQTTPIANTYYNPNTNYNPQPPLHNQYGIQNEGGYSISQPVDNTQILEREMQALQELEEQHRRLLLQIKSRVQGDVYYNKDTSLTRKVITQYPNEQNTYQFSSELPSNGNAPNTIMIMDPSSQGVGSDGNPYSTTQIRISRHPGQVPSSVLEHKYKRGMGEEISNANIKLVRETQMTRPVLVGLKLSPNGKNDLWNYFELKSSEHIRSIYQSNTKKPLIPYPDLLPPCPGDFLCDDITKPANPNDKDLHETKNPQNEDPQTSENDEKGKPKLNPFDEPTQDSEGPSTGDEPQPQSPDKSTTENPEIAMHDTTDDNSPQKESDHKFIFFEPDDHEEPDEAEKDPTNDVDPRSSTAISPLPEPDTNGIMYKISD